MVLRGVIILWNDVFIIFWIFYGCDVSMKIVKFLTAY